MEDWVACSGSPTFSLNNVVLLMIDLDPIGYFGKQPNRPVALNWCLNHMSVFWLTMGMCSPIMSSQLMVMLHWILPPEDSIQMSLCFVPNSTGKIRYQLNNKN
jgi:hypothetical protein